MKSSTPPIVIRELGPDDQSQVVFVDGIHTGEPKPDYWKTIFRNYLKGRSHRLTFGLGADVEGRLAGYLFGEVRAVEFGSEPCGWVFAVGVNADETRQGVASALLRDAVARFHDAGVTKIRTMVRRDDVAVLSFFRAGGFVGGSFVQLELDCGADQR